MTTIQTLNVTTTTIDTETEDPAVNELAGTAPAIPGGADTFEAAKPAATTAPPPPPPTMAQLEEQLKELLATKAALRTAQMAQQMMEAMNSKDGGASANPFGDPSSVGTGHGLNGLVGVLLMEKIRGGITALAAQFEEISKTPPKP